MKKFLFFVLFFLSVFFYFFVGKTQEAKNINWGVIFSQKHSQLMGLDWKANYLAILEDLKVKNLKIITHWDLIEPEEGKYNFEDLDWQIKEAEKRNTKIILVIGLKTGRWPECHLPKWAKCEKEIVQCQDALLNYLERIITHYQDSDTILAWQIENEPFFPFGECPKIEKNFVKKEIELVKILDQKPIIFADSGEFSFWITAAQLGDIVSSTLHRRVYFKEIGTYISYPFPPIYYWRKAGIIKTLFGKKVIVGELQAEPWCKNLLYNCPLEEQEITMDFSQFKENIEFAKKTGLDTFYFWGVEWWYWLKVQKNRPEIWQEAKKMF